MIEMVYEDISILVLAQFFFNRVSSILIYPCCYLFIIIFICGKKAVIEFRWLEGSFYALE